MTTWGKLSRRGRDMRLRDLIRDNRQVGVFLLGFWLSFGPVYLVLLALLAQHPSAWSIGTVVGRGSRDFDDLDAYRRFVDEIVGRQNADRRKRIEWGG